MRTAWLLPVLLISLPPACSDEDGSDDNAAGSAGNNAGGAAGRGAAGASGGAGLSGAAGAAGRGAAGSGGAAGAAGSGGAAGAAGASGAAGAGGSSASDATGCEGLCARPLVCPDDTPAECISSCEFAAELCPDEFEAVLECMDPLSDSELQCVGGVPVPDDDLCVPESAAFARCRIGF
jgi:hypothetical protein